MPPPPGLPIALPHREDFIDEPPTQDTRYIIKLRLTSRTSSPKMDYGGKGILNPC